MTRRPDAVFPTIRTEGGLLPADLLRRISLGDRSVPGLKAEDYHLAPGERLTEAIGRAWTRLLLAWAGFRASMEQAPAGELGTSITRERWLMILFQELGYGRLPVARGVTAGGEAVPISHLWQNVPIHLVGFRIELDRRTPGATGAARASPHALVQSLLNTGSGHLWGFLGNGLKLRLLRSSASLTRQAYVEFDLAAMMDGEVYSDFAVLWLVAHQSRVEARPGEGDEATGPAWLEAWMRVAQEQGTRALEDLRQGVEVAITTLGRGFLRHPANGAIREALRSGSLSTKGFYGQLLRLVYRTIFLFVSEDRGVLVGSSADPTASIRFAQHYSTARLRRVAQTQRGSRHGDLWRALRLVMGLLGRDEGCPALGLPALGGPLWSKGAIESVGGAELANIDLLEGIRALAFRQMDHHLRPVSYRDLGAEELGSVYEALLDLHPYVNVDQGGFELKTAGGSDRKTTGSYYTPHSLVASLLESALDPVLQRAVEEPDPAAAILRLRVVDPACGSGHFLVAAAHRIARRLAAVRTGEPEPSPEATRTALRDVIGHCIFGVDMNPMAVELCKVGLWLESVEPGRPLAFLEHHVVEGNSLLGTAPNLVAQGIPDAAYDTVTGDEPELAREAKRRNRDERSGQTTLFGAMVAEGPNPQHELATDFAALDAVDDFSIGGLHEKERRLQAIRASYSFRQAHLEADTWCAAFFWPKTRLSPPAPTHATLENIRSRPLAVPASVRSRVAALAEDLRFFHWHLVFPEVFSAQRGTVSRTAGWCGGFDVVLGNPPWERVKIQEKGKRSAKLV